MDTMDGLIFVLWAVAGFLALAAVGYLLSLFNSLVQVKNNIGKAWHNIDVLLQQRNEELQKLADAVRAYVDYENSVLPRLVELRARYLRARDTAARTRVENEMKAGLGRLGALWEGHPDLRANAAIQHLQVRISALEDAIADRRGFFNDTVTIYNTRIAVIPQLIIARMLRWQAHPLLEVPSQGKQARHGKRE